MCLKGGFNSEKMLPMQKSHFTKKKKKILRISFPSVIPTQDDFHIFLHVFTYCILKLVIRSGKSNFFPKIPHFCRIGLFLAETY